MNDEIVSRFIDYLPGVKTYCKVLKTYYQKEELDDFDCWYLELYQSFVEYLKKQFENQNSALVQLAKNYQELVVDYNESLLYNCLQALDRGYSRLQVYNEGKKEVYLHYLKYKYNINGKLLLSMMNEEEFKVFEENVFNDTYIKKVIAQMTNCTECNR